MLKTDNEAGDEADFDFFSYSFSSSAMIASPNNNLNFLIHANSIYKCLVSTSLHCACSS